jgi:YD repeat-containing protein
LKSETLVSSGAGAPAGYTDSYTYDLDGNRLTESIKGGSTGDGSIAYSYDNDDQLTNEAGTYIISSQNYQTVYTYDSNGNLKTETRTGRGVTVHYQFSNWWRTMQDFVSGT